MTENDTTVYQVLQKLPKISSASVTLGDNLALNFYVDGIADDTAAAEYTVNFTGACVDESSALAYNATEGKYYATTHVYAKDIDKNITATLCKGDDTVDTVEDYSISQYLSSDAFSGADEKTSALITATKDFGNASSEYFYGIGSGYSDGFASYAPDATAYAPSFTSDDAKLSLVLDSKTAARLYVKDDTTGTESTINATKADYPSYHEVAGLLPQNLADEQTINVGGTDYKFSALSWCNRVLTNGSASQKNVNMAKAIMAYYTAAKNYSSVDVSSVTIKNAPTEALFVNSTGTLTATVSPDNATDKTVVWSSSDPDYVSINAETGEYTIMGTKGYGSATITATATNGTEDTSDDVSATCTITGKVHHTSLQVGDVIRVGETIYTGDKWQVNISPNTSFITAHGVITLVEDKTGSTTYYKMKRGSNGAIPNWTSFKVTDATDGLYIV
ncbi:Ig-like domain-containing protein, partial [Ruminococcus sp.]|uniref:Ig-like domain-containing protein n=1 Tax=Ruminococcus sp. TaxID=41978 RepID=UPI0025E6C356